MLKMYGIPNCNTVKKAQDALAKRKVSYQFINFKKEAPTKELIKRLKDQLGDWPVNTKGPTYRKIKEEFEGATAAGKVALLIENSSAIKRPILEKDGKMIAIGFDEEKYKTIK